MAKLCQLIAVEKSVKNKAQTVITEAYHKIQKPALLAGISRTYRPLDELGEQLPAESTRVQTTVDELIRDVSKTMIDLFDVTASKDWGNCKAVANVVVDGVTLMQNVPVTYLLFIEKKLVDIHTFVSKMPVLDPSEDWQFDPNVGHFASKPSETMRTKKLSVPLVLAPATDKHPAQVKEVTEDKAVGTWRTVKFSGAWPAQRVADVLDRIERLQRAVKFARENANSSEVEQVNVGKCVFDFLLG